MTNSKVNPETDFVNISHHYVIRYIYLVKIYKKEAYRIYYLFF